MIIVNGSIQRKVKAGGGIDPTNGYPITATSVWGESIPCQYVPTSQNLQARAAGEPTARRHYAIYIEGYERCEVSDNEQVLLNDECGHMIGEFSVISVTPLRAVDQTRIDV